MDFINTPQTLYHGTVSSYTDSFRQKLLNQQYWKPGRDFGEGFYTTISFTQAKKWARKSERESVPASRACVLEIELISIPGRVTTNVFLGNNRTWSDYIFDHRRVQTKGSDPCGKKHADLIVGPMADNDTGKILRDAVLLNQGYQWFYDQIIRTGRGRRLDSLRLGNQVVFSTERFESSLRLVGYYIYAGGRWIYHDSSSATEQL